MMYEKIKAYTCFIKNIVYSSPQYDFFGRNAGLPFFNAISGGFL